MADKIFINYRRDDSIGMAGRLHDRLAQTFGRDKLFMDVDHIPVGVDFVTHLNNQVAACDIMLVVIGPNWLTANDEAGQRRLDQPDDFVAIEIAAALARDIRVIPVLVEQARVAIPAAALMTMLVLVIVFAVKSQSPSAGNVRITDDRKAPTSAEGNQSGIKGQAPVQDRYEALLSQGNTESQAGNYDRAIATFGEAIRSEPEICDAFYLRGNTRARKGDYRQAIVDYNSALRISPDHAEALCARGRAKLKINDPSGRADIAKARKLDPSACP